MQFKIMVFRIVTFYFYCEKDTHDPILEHITKNKKETVISSHRIEPLSVSAIASN